MTLAICSVDALPRIGGVSVMAHELSNAFCELGERVVFVGPRGSYVPKEYNRRYSSYEDLEFDKRSGTGRGAVEEDRRIARLFGRIITREAPSRILLIHPHHYGIGAQMAADDAGIPLSVYFHGFELRSQLRGEYPADASAQIAEHWPTSLRHRSFSTIANAQELLANSHYTAGLLEPFPKRPPITVTGCGIASGLMAGLDRDHDTAAARMRLGIPVGVPVLAFVGRVEPTKRAERLLDIAAHMPDAHVLVAGSGPGDAALADAARASQLGDRLQIMGRVGEATKHDVLAAADFACLLSEPDDISGRVEGFGIALLEGAALGAVPVSSGTGGMGDVVEDGRTGLILPPALPDQAAAEKLTAALGNRAAMDQIRAAALAQLRRDFNWLTIAGNMQRRWRERLAA